jgi:hypothetical protein
MIKQIIAKEIKLISVLDLRPIDFQSGKRLAIPTSECNICDRCEKLHVKVYEVQADEKTYRVGSTCCKRLFGWEPEEKEIKSKEKIAEEKALKEALEKAAQKFINEINTLPIPTPKFRNIQQCHFGPAYIFEADGILAVAKDGQVRLTDENLVAFAKEWREKKLQAALKAYEIEYTGAQLKKAKQITEQAKVLFKKEK